MRVVRLRSTLLGIAQLVVLAPGCGGSIARATADGDSGAPADASLEAGVEASLEASADAGEGSMPDACTNPCACEPAFPSGMGTAAQACVIAAEIAAYLASDAGGAGTGNYFPPYEPACISFCQQLGNSGGDDLACEEPAYFDAYESALDASDADADGGAECPAWSGGVLIRCLYSCGGTGRRVHGITEPPRAGESVGALLAERAYLEAVSVHAFETLERELEAHGAPVELLRDARRARRDEVRHTAMMARLARRFEGSPEPFAAPPPAPVRGLLEIALENAVEGCVRETYGAVVGLVEARLSRDAGVRRAMRSIAEDECRHAELAWRVAAWIAPRLTAEERVQVDRTTRDAVVTLRREGDTEIAGLLAERVWTDALPAMSA